MKKCVKCQSDSQAVCSRCTFLIDGSELQRKLSVPRKVLLKTDQKKQFVGDLFVVSPIGLGIQADLIPSENYTINFNNNLQIQIKKILTRGKNNFHGFDIVLVNRSGQSSERLNNDEYRLLTQSNEQLLSEITDTLPENVKDIIHERLKVELQKAKLLDSLQVSQIYRYSQGILKLLSAGPHRTVIPEAELSAIAAQCTKTESPTREVIVHDNNKMYDVHGIPFDSQSGGIVVLDVSFIVEQERELNQKKLLIYKEAIGAITGGKLLLVEKEEISCYIAKEDTLLEIELTKPEQLDFIRNDIETILIEKGTSNKDIYLTLVSISEALTNALKHANGGKCLVRLIPSGLSVAISDNGPGIDFNNLPKATLMSHFSTTNSLGCGYAIMLKFMDNLILSTDQNGTTIILQKLNLY